jgi:hypothetical protein
LTFLSFLVYFALAAFSSSEIGFMNSITVLYW